ELIEDYVESNEYFFEEDKISYDNKHAIDFLDELDKDINSCKEFISEISSNSISSCDKLSSDSLLTLDKNKFFDDIANKALDSDK
ncbi:17954_t:CDS:1, partial [Racocetra fulgida]